MKRMIETQNNYTNYIIIEDTDENKSCVYDYDLNEDEVKELVEEFESGKLTYDFVKWLEGVDTAYEPFRQWGNNLLTIII